MEVDVGGAHGGRSGCRIGGGGGEGGCCQEGICCAKTKCGKDATKSICCGIEVAEDGPWNVQWL